ncbi:hypothetical protein BH09PSE5_BH09PSE5_48690 [soil metagenome]
MSRHVFNTGALVSTAAAALFGTLAIQGGSALYGVIGVGLFLLAGVFALAGAVATVRNARRYIAGSLWIAAFTVIVVAVLLGQGVQSIALGFVPLLACVACTMVGTATGLGISLAGIVAVVFLAAAQHHGLAFEGIADVGEQLFVRTFGVSLLMISGAAAGWVLARVLSAAMHSTLERERRFHGLLGIAADFYWEQDDQFRFTHMSRTSSRRAASGALEGSPAAEHPAIDFDGLADGLTEADDPALREVLDRFLGKAMWEAEESALTPAQWDGLRADLELRQPFRDLVMRLVDSDGQPTFVSVSGEPLFDSKARFRGYWGVTRFITEEVIARSSVQSSELRYRELFALSPSPLLLQRGGVVVDANQAALSMFDRARPAGMVGTELVELYEEGPSRDRVRAELAQLEELRVGEGLGVADYGMRAWDGRHLDVQACSVQVDTDEGPASLFIYFDITSRMEAEAAVRRSEAMLAHLIATSPDLIALSELDNGRYALVNEGFCRVTGYSSGEVVGKTTTEVPIWQRPGDRQRLVTQVRQLGSVRDVPLSLVNRLGQPVSMVASAARFDMDGRSYLVMSGRDVTESERLRLEYEAILQNASIGIAFVREGMFLHANPRFDQMLGWPAGVLTGRPVSAVWPTESGEDGIAQAGFDAHIDGEPFEVERQLTRRDGTRVLCRIMAQAIDPTHPSRGGTIWITEDITERRRVEQALERALDQAESANRAKSAFLANTSHEIRTPLNGLLGLARLSLQPGVDEGQRTGYLNQLLDSAQNLSVIISDILDLSKIEAGKLSFESVPFELHEMLESVHRAYFPLADARGIELQLRIDPTLPQTVLGDATRVRQILGNYISNALKFTESGYVRIAAEPSVKELGRVWMAVSDSGAGIDEETLGRLFSAFTQADQSTTRRYGGTGLGLSICRELATLMGGEVGASSQPGLGSTFWADLRLPATERSVPEVFDRIGAAAALDGTKVLLVEDNAVNMLIANALLEQWGVIVTQAHDGEQAVRAVTLAADEGRLFDAVLMDVQMPVMSGHEASRRLRERFDSEDLPIIALTAAVLVSEREEALASGMNEFLSKPIDADKLQATLVKVMGRQRV